MDTLRNLIRGSMLIESLVSLSIVSVGSLGVVGLQGKLIRSQAEVNQKNQAMQIAKTKIEQLRNYTTANEYDAIAAGTESASGSGTSYTSAWRVNNFTSPDYKNVNVDVSWTKVDGTTDSLTLGTRISKLDTLYEGKAISPSFLNPPIALTPSDAQPVPTPVPVTDPDNPLLKSITLNDGTVIAIDVGSNEATINGNVAVNISGIISEASIAADAPTGSINYSDVTVTSIGSGSNYCFSTVGDTYVSYQCVVQHTVFDGTIYIGGVTGAKLCASMPSNIYTSPTESLTGQNYKFFKSSRTCAGDTPYEIGVL